MHSSSLVEHHVRGGGDAGAEATDWVVCARCLSFFQLGVARLPNVCFCVWSYMLSPVWRQSLLFWAAVRRGLLFYVNLEVVSFRFHVPTLRVCAGFTLG